MKACKSYRFDVPICAFDCNWRSVRAAESARARVRVGRELLREVRRGLHGAERASSCSSSEASRASAACRAVSAASTVSPLCALSLPELSFTEQRPYHYGRLGSQQENWRPGALPPPQARDVLPGAVEDGVDHEVRRGVVPAGGGRRSGRSTKQRRKNAARCGERRIPS